MTEPLGGYVHALALGQQYAVCDVAQRAQRVERNARQASRTQQGLRRSPDEVALTAWTTTAVRKNQGARIAGLRRRRQVVRSSTGVTYPLACTRLFSR